MNELLEILIRIEQSVKESKLNDKTTFNVNDLCEYTGMSKSQIYKLTSEGLIPHNSPTGKLLFFNKKDIDFWLIKNSKF